MTKTDANITIHCKLVTETNADAMASSQRIVANPLFFSILILITLKLVVPIIETRFGPNLLRFDENFRRLALQLWLTGRHSHRWYNASSSVVWNQAASPTCVIKENLQNNSLLLNHKITLTPDG